MEPMVDLPWQRLYGLTDLQQLEARAYLLAALWDTVGEERFAEMLDRAITHARENS